MGNVGITLSTTDQAGANMLGAFREMGFQETDRGDVLRLGEVYIVVLDPLIVPEERYKVPAEPDPYPADYDGIAEALDLNYYVVASRHWARSGKPSLTVHPTGNFGKAMYGGRNRELQRILANPMRDVFLELLEDPPHGFEVSLEATHHSPTQFETPMFFAELGSGLSQWQDEEMGRYLAEAILKGVRRVGKVQVAIGFGGGHYCPTFTVKERETAFGHMAAKYALDLLTPDLIEQMVERTMDGVDRAVFDKGLKGHQRKKVEVALKKLDVEIEG
ncbi:MAG TPA: D-aminoacyl-tRNA deacylase [Patescibacteria group bacterium]|nr:D-aminoacyl-tRNA deacylase [Patescibacteria group bacterium]